MSPSPNQDYTGKKNNAPCQTILIIQDCFQEDGGGSLSSSRYHTSQVTITLLDQQFCLKDFNLGIYSHAHVLLIWEKAMYISLFRKITQVTSVFSLWGRFKYQIMALITPTPEKDVMLEEMAHWKFGTFPDVR